MAEPALDRYVVTEPGSPAAREFGCTCPAVEPRPTETGGLRYVRAAGCPLHRLFALSFVDIAEVEG